MRFLSTGFYMLLSILGLSVISLGSLIGVQIYRGKLTANDLRSVMRVIGGTHRIIIPTDAYNRYVEFSKDEDKARAELESNRGLPETRVPAAIRALETQAAQQDNLAVLNRLLANEKRVVEEVRAQVESQKKQVEDLRRALDDERQKNLAVSMNEATKKLQKTLAEMDAGDVAVFLASIVRDPSQGGPPEAARIVRDHLKADFSAEVLGEMPPLDRQRILPLLENRFAGVPPEAVVKIFNDNQVGAGEVMLYLMRMNPAQALGVYLRLSPELQEKVSPQLLRQL